MATPWDEIDADIDQARMMTEQGAGAYSGFGVYALRVTVQLVKALCRAIYSVGVILEKGDR